MKRLLPTGLEISALSHSLSPVFTAFLIPLQPGT